MAAPQAAAAPGAGPRPAQLVWTTADAGVFALEVPADTLADFERARRAELDTERARLQQVVASMLAAGLGEVLTDLIARLPVYGDWVYGWINSYVTALQVGARSVSEDGAAADRALGSRIADAMRDAAATRLDATVVRPVAPGARLRDAVAAIDVALAQEWQRVLARDRARWSGLATTYAGSARRADDTVRHGPLSCRVAPPPLAPDRIGLDEAALIASLVESQQGLFGLRLARPIALRAVAVAGRLAAGGLALAGSGLVAAGAAPVGTFALPWTMVGGLVWSLDYAVNRVDGLLHRGRLEAGFVAELVATLDRRRAELETRAAAGIDVAFDSLAACRLPPPPPAPPVG